MQIVVNGEAREVPNELTVAELVAHLGLSGGPVAVEVDREIVPRSEHAKRRLIGGEAIEIVHFVGGG